MRANIRNFTCTYTLRTPLLAAFENCFRKKLNLPHSCVLLPPPPPNDGPTHLGCDQADVDVLPEVHVVVLHHTQQEAVAQTQGGTRLHGSQDAGVQLGLDGGGGEGTQQATGGTSEEGSRLHDGRDARVQLGLTMRGGATHKAGELLLEERLRKTHKFGDIK